MPTVAECRIMPCKGQNEAFRTTRRTTRRIPSATGPLHRLAGVETKYGTGWQALVTGTRKRERTRSPESRDIGAHARTDQGPWRLLRRGAHTSLLGAGEEERSCCNGCVRTQLVLMSGNEAVAHGECECRPEKTARPTKLEGDEAG
jgi:hypothetical protein